PPPEMAERRDQRLVSIDEFRPGLGNATTKNRCLLVVAFDQVGDCVRVVEQGWVRLYRSQVAVSLQPLQGNLWFADVAVGQCAERPNECQVGIQPQRSLEIMQCRVEVLVEERAYVAINPQRLGIFGIKPYCAEGVSLRGGKCPLGI